MCLELVKVPLMTNLIICSRMYVKVNSIEVHVKMAFFEIVDVYYIHNLVQLLDGLSLHVSI